MVLECGYYDEALLCSKKTPEPLRVEDRVPDCVRGTARDGRKGVGECKGPSSSCDRK